MCDEVTMGLFALQTLLILHQSLFLPVMLFNSCSWTKLTQSDTITLQRVQTKFLKRMLHSPQSTPNSVTYLETGVVPLTYEIHKRQLNFLHHILTLEAHDPVRKMYEQLLKYPYEPNWSNEIWSLRRKYELQQRK